MIYQQENSVGQDFFECILYRDFQYVPHMHRHPELVFVREGTLEIRLGEHTELLQANEFALIPSNCLHAYTTPDRSLVDCCIFSEAFIPTFFKETRSKRASSVRFTCNDAVREYALRVLFTARPVPDRYTLKSVFYAITGQYRQQVRFTRITAKNELLMNRLIQYVSENFRENITLKSIAKTFGYEEHYLSRCFHNVIPMHFSRYVNLFRVDAATELLQHTDLPITEIALQSGFQSIRNFNRVFLEITGKTPSRQFK
jgi:AraC-like DNA-binding protein